jgi:3-oxoacyl-[acyl-carrier protein] reductase
MDLGIKGRVAVVAGGARGCGFAIAFDLAREGAHVVITSRNAAPLTEAVTKLRNAGGEAHGVVANMNLKPDAIRIAKEARTAFGDPSILVINPAQTNLKAGFDNTTDEAFRESNNDFIMSHVYLLRELLPAMKANRWGRIVSIGSASQKMPQLADPFYTGSIRVSSAAFIKVLSGEYGRHGITANTICTGPFMSELAKNHLKGATALAESAVAERSAVGRWAQPHEMGGIVAFLCSERAGYITGEAIRVDGGYSHNLF